jgi:hypothetical protein
MKETIDFHSFELELSKWLNVWHIQLIQIISISKHKDRTCKEIVAELPLSQSTVSKH